MPLFNLDYLSHIYDEAIYIVEQTDELEFKHFIIEETLKRAIVRSVEVIGEASKKMSPEHKQQ